MIFSLLMGIELYKVTFLVSPISKSTFLVLRLILISLTIIFISLYVPLFVVALRVVVPSFKAFIVLLFNSIILESYSYLIILIFYFNI